MIATRSALVTPPLYSRWADGDHEIVHSFPTRRSSELHAQRPVQLGGVAAALVNLQGHLGAVNDHGHDARRAGRSEEHTSELQSLRHLVCRLLLEKKNVPRQSSSRRRSSP